MNGAQAVIRAMREEGIDTLFGYPGGAIMPLYDALPDSGLRHVLVRHEQAAAHAAEGWARASGRPGVCVATSGPGATNLVTGLADAFLDSVPLVAVTGQVPTAVGGTDAFQEVDIVGITLPVVKHSFRVRRAADLADAAWRSFRIASSGRGGPVLLDLPKDVALAECPPRAARAWSSPDAFDGNAVEAAARLIREAKRPLIYAGGGIHQAGARTAFRALASRLDAPVVCTLKGLGVLPTGHPRLLGMMGMHGSARSNRALADCDLLLALGARFDDRATGRLETFCPDARVVHADIDASELGKLRLPDVAVPGDLRETLPALAEIARQVPDWEHGAPEPRAAWSASSPCPRDVMEALEADIVTTDVGQHQMWAAQFIRFHDGLTFLTSGGLGTMGFGLPAAIGAQVARPSARVACLTGDGSFMMMVHELATLRRYGLPVKIVLLDNRCLGMVRQWQEMFHGNRESEIDLADNPDFVRVAEAFGVPGRRVTRQGEVAGAMREALQSDGPFLLHVVIERAANVWPIVPPGRANHEALREGA